MSGEITLLEAISQGLRDEMRADPRVFLIGEDIGRYGGAFRVTSGFLDEFGPERVIDTPISESGFTGAAIGAAMMGLRPVVEFQFIDFMANAFDMIVNFAGTNHYRWGQCVPMVMRGPSGGRVSGSAFHSANPEGYYHRAPGLKIVYPSHVDDAYGLIRAAVRDPNPVLFFEHKYLYRRIKGTLPEGLETTPIGKARIVREGSHATVVTWAAMVHVALEAAAKLAEEGVELEIVDLRTIKPMDEECVLASVRKTNRALVLSEEPYTGSVAGDIAARIAEKAFWHLDAPLARVTCLDTPVPYSPPMEDYYLPNADKLAARVRELLAA
ncbi:MAG TPA: alpha-ketoacid dehydrogenase subunit beta [Thermoanaerobaculia bacterium]|nr:alpha-ketoacid dehydrogenase subunit beta [Thermoanaerobaculia bacterium]